MKKKNFLALFIASFFIFVAVPGVVHAEEGAKKTKKAKKISASATKSCENRKFMVGGFAKDMSFYNNNYYVMPAGAQLEKYPLKNTKVLDPDAAKGWSTKKLRSDKGKVTIFSKGKEVEATRHNYSMTLDRHRMMREIAEKKVSVAAYNTTIFALRDKIAEASGDINKMTTDWNTEAGDIRAVDCKTADGVKKAGSLAKLRTKYLKEIKDDLRNVKTLAKKTNAEYGKVSKEYIKKVKAENAQEAKKPPASGGGED
jgi:hypothetical protein